MLPFNFEPAPYIAITGLLVPIHQFGFPSLFGFRKYNLAVNFSSISLLDPLAFFYLVKVLVN